jgi:hypothetical protein
MGKKPLVGLLGLFAALLAVSGGCETSKPYQDPKGKYRPAPMFDTSATKTKTPAPGDAPAPSAVDSKSTSPTSAASRTNDLTQSSGMSNSGSMTTAAATTPVTATVGTPGNSTTALPTSARQESLRTSSNEWNSTPTTGGMPGRNDGREGTSAVVRDVPPPPSAGMMTGTHDLPPISNPPTSRFAPQTSTAGPPNMAVPTTNAVPPLPSTNTIGSTPSASLPPVPVERLP